MPEESVNAWSYQVFKRAGDTEAVESGDPELAGFFFAFRDEGAEGWPPEYPRQAPDPEGVPGDGFGSDG